MIRTCTSMRVYHCGEIIYVSGVTTLFGWKSQHLREGEVYFAIQGIFDKQDLRLSIPARYPRAIRNWALVKYLLGHFIQAANQRAGVLSALSHAE
jgi:hypothetical protein